MELVLNSKGVPVRHIVRGRDKKPIILSLKEQTLADHEENHVKNVIGFDVPITTMTTIARKITEQKFYEVPFAEYVPVVEGQGAFGDSILTYRAFEIGDSFETGIVNMAQNNSRIASADAGVDAIRVPTYFWNKMITWTLPQIEMAAKAGNWDVVASLEKARKKNWDLGIQRIAFLGAQGFQTPQANCYGLLTLPNVATDTSVFQASGNVPISKMTVTQLNVFVANLINLYRQNNNRTAWPTHFFIPEFDYIGMSTQYSPTFPTGSILKILEEAFKQQVPDGKFKGIKPLSYAMPQYSFGALAFNTYVLINYDEETFNMQIPVPYTTTVPNSLNNYALQDVGYGQYTGVAAFRPREILYLNGGF